MEKPNQANVKKERRGLSEKQVAWLMIAPAILIILVIAIWPVIRSFWISMYDVRLNDPTKSQIHSEYAIDVEKYANMHPLLLGAIDRETADAKGEGPQALDEMREQVLNVKQTLEAEGDFQQRYTEIDELLFAYKPVPEELKYVESSEEQITTMKTTFEGMHQRVLDLSTKQAFAKPEDLISLIKGIQGSIIEPNFVGLKYYGEFLTDSRMWASLGNTLFFTVVSVGVELALGLWIALLINRQFRGRGLVRASILIPWAIPTVISALMWKFMYDGQNGILAYLLDLFGLIPDMGWLLTTKAGAMISVIVSDVWKTTPFMALLLFAGLQTIPQSLYEAAEVDGATRRQQFFKITLPMLKSTIMVALVFRTLDAFRVFDLIYVLTGGGPANSTETISIYAYKTMFAQMDFGAGSALSVLVFLCVALISIGYIKLLGADLVGEKSGK